MDLRRSAVAIVAGSVAALALVSCGGSDDDASPSVTTRPAASDTSETAAPSSSTTSTTVASTTVAPPPTDTPTTVAPTTVAPTPPPTQSGVGAAIALLSVAQEGPRTGYDRDSFHYGVDDDRDRCFTRCEALASQRRFDLPGLPGGGWLSTYDGYSTPNADELEIDHVIPLSEAWDSGASGWDEARRRELANDPAELNAVSRSMNRSKGDDDPAEWQPPSRDSWCQYVTTWTLVKLKYGLTADPAEVRALTDMAAGCP